ncbi:Ribonuclease H domain [Arabidopsis suecica]|uniref:Ribonuclease H domain n=1 Tax=Arabidopsis suecica TaxID=45249 RepID=A0A8T1ZG19_ARASU|nr:Ribonuclease H domain [Arabidopsis suecica]
MMGIGYGPNDIWEESERGMEEIATNYFKELFKVSNTNGIADMVNEVPPVITENMNKELTKEVTEKEVRKALFSMHPEKTPGPDGRLITDNILLAQEMFHGLQTNRMCRTDFLAIKTDMSKAYDMIEWDFLEAVMTRLGFDSAWVSWIMWSVSSVSYQVLLNGEPRGNIIPNRGLRQGDPLSPYLFILCTEVLIANINKAEREKKLTGIKIAKRSPAISHLLFADDSLFFCKADSEQCKTVMNIIGNYGKASGQEISFSKSSVMFGKRVANQKKDQLKNILGITKEGGMGTYLGIPESLGGSKSGKETMIKSVALALPTYVMSCFKLPQELTSKLTSAISNYWWSSNGRDRGIHWIAWEKMCKDKEEGGLGFHSLDTFNDAMLAKQYWRLIQYPNSLVARVLKGRYFRNIHPLHAKKPNSPSFGWKSIFSTKRLVTMGARWSIGSGFNLSVWRDPWIPDVNPRPANGRGKSLLPSLMVNHLINPVSKEWHLPILQEYLDPVDIQFIRGLTISQVYKPDRLIWHHTKSGRYTVKSGYQVAREMTEPIEWGPNYKSLQAQAWKIKCPPKIKHFLWQIASGALAVTSKLAHRGIQCDIICKRCELAEETINHALFECSHSQKIWELSTIPTASGSFPLSSELSNLDYLYWRLPSTLDGGEKTNLYAWILWFIWKDRNKKVFKGLQSDPTDILNHALSEKSLWEEAQLEPIETSPITETMESPVQTIRCRIDGSWKNSDPTMGIGWWCFQGTEQTILLGAKCLRRCPSPLHSEMEALIWAMKNILSRRIDCQAFETDCSELISMIQSPDEWPAFSNLLDEFGLLRAYFPFFSLSLISRLCNVKADCSARSSRLLFSEISFVDSFPPNWTTNLGVIY